MLPASEVGMLSAAESDEVCSVGFMEEGLFFFSESGRVAACVCAWKMFVIIIGTQRQADVQLQGPPLRGVGQNEESSIAEIWVFFNLPGSFWF